MNMELGTIADIEGERVPVIVSYEVDGIKPLIYGVFTADDKDEDVTLLLVDAVYDRIYEEVSQHVVDRYVAAAEYLSDMER